MAAARQHDRHQLYFAMGLPILAGLPSLIVSLLWISGIRADGRGLRQGFADLCRDANGARETIRKEARQERAEIAGDLKLLTGKVVEIDNRLTRIEERLGPHSTGRRDGGAPPC
jgi:hypothetical protein